MRRLTVLFAIFLVFVVITANLGVVGDLFGWLVDYPHGDKVGHFALYGILALIVALGFSISRARLGFWHPLKSTLLIAAIAILEEISQFFFIYRSPDLIDLLAGLAGIFLFSEIGAWLRAIRIRRNSQPPVQSS